MWSRGREPTWGQVSKHKLGEPAEGEGEGCHERWRGRHSYLALPILPGKNVVRYLPLKKKKKKNHNSRFLQAISPVVNVANEFKTLLVN